MIQRALFDIAFSDDWGRQMRFISGPRQCGKTTLAKQKLTHENCRDLYYSWDLRTVRNRYKSNEMFFTADKAPGNQKAWLCFDEIHKMPKWKNILKGIYDEMQDHYAFIITGSAKFEIARRSGDSLSGRYFSFHLFPLCLDEILQTFQENQKPPGDITEFLLSKLEPKPAGRQALETLLAFGGFPEPQVNQKKAFLAKWVNDYVDTVIREDIRPLTRILEIDHLYDLYTLLPSFIGSTLSESSLAGHIQVSPVTLKNYLKRLADFHLIFQLHPYAKNIKRSLLRATKGYLYNWTAIQDAGAQFENYVACELKIRTTRWSDVSGIPFNLFYVKNKQNQETDFLITKNNAPWLLVETKLSDARIDQHHYSFAQQLGVPLVQVCKQSDIASLEKKNVYRISAERFLG
jgi:uncharacterized protein